MALSVSISMCSSKYTWDDVDKRAEELGIDRSKYTQRLIELDLEHKLLSNPIMLGWIQKGKKHTMRIIDYVLFLFLMAIFLLVLVGYMNW